MTTFNFRKTSLDIDQPKSWRTWLIGRPLPTADAPNQAIGKLIGLAVFASDALSSTAYAHARIDDYSGLCRYLGFSLFYTDFFCNRGTSGNPDHLI